MAPALAISSRTTFPIACLLGVAGRLCILKRANDVSKPGYPTAAKPARSSTTRDQLLSSGEMK
jgi:hypothetical protein